MAFLRLQFFAVVTVLTFASTAFGDGCYMPVQAVKKIPTIPAQRAVISWRAGQETLVISSSLDSESQKLGWIIPLPAVPQKIEKESPGALKTLDFCLQPEVEHDFSGELTVTLFAVLVGNVLLGTLAFGRKHFIAVLTVVCVLFVFWSLLLPASGGGGVTAAKTANAIVKKTVAVGAYDIDVLRPTKPNELNEWLAKNGFSSLPPAADATVADYIANGWVFVAVKLTRATAGVNAPHPIRMTFPSKTPLYPLKLTALAGGNTAFEIFVVADNRVSCKLVDEEFCDRFVEDVDYKDDSPKYYHYEIDRCFYGETTHQTVGHRAICSLMWNKCVVTKFSGTLGADAMKSDLLFNQVPFAPFRQHFYTTVGARTYAIIWFIGLFGVWLAVTMLICEKTIKQPRGCRRYFGRVLLPGVIVFAAATALLYICLPKIAMADVALGRFRQFRFAINFRDVVDDLAQKEQNILQCTTAEITDRLLKGFTRPDANGVVKKADAKNAITGDAMIEEDTPGNFRIEKTADRFIIRVYDASGRAMTVELPVKKSGPKGQGGEN
jgi:hypothetical protein